MQSSTNLVNVTNTLEARQAKRSYDSALQSLRLTQEQTKLSVENSYYTLVQDADLVALADSFDIRRPVDLLQRVAGAVARWPEFARRAGVPQAKIDRITAYHPEWVTRSALRRPVSKASSP